MFQLDSELAQKGIKPRHYDVGSQKIKCPECQPHSHNPKDNPLSLTIKPDNSAVWKCHHCEWSGGVGNSSSTYIKPYVAPKIPEVKRPAGFLYAFFKDRSISKETVDRFKIFSENNWIGFQYFDENHKLANIKYRTVDKQFRQSPNAKRVLYNYDRVNKSDTVIFVEGEMDVLSLAEVGYDYATTLPDGAPSAAKFDKNDARFKALAASPLVAKKVVLFLDKDSSGKALHAELKHRLGSDITWYVTGVPEGCKDASDVLMKHGPHKLKEIVDNAIPYPIDGLYKAKDYTSHVLDLYEGNFTKPLEIGMGRLDDIFKVMPSTFTTITGIPNHGKSIFLDQILLKLAKRYDWKFAIFSPEHSTQMHIRRLVQMHLEKGFDEGFGNRMSKDELLTALDYINDHFFFIETREAVPNIQLITDIARQSVYKHSCNALIIDPYNEVSAKREGNVREDEHIRDFISILKRFARVYENWVAVVAHPTKLPKTTDGSYLPPTAYDISGSSHWHNQSDAVLTIHRDFEDNSINVLTRKIREQDLYGKIGQVKFYYDLDRKCFIEKSAGDWDDFTV